ncbi:hypothetical protein XELAEV_18026928mg [Xenopus laevis]|uniref:Helix-turn-helix domain-containing protein n=1 Tax=Xenopus laevis TaxID=8355 RepID=A0A974CVA8_XENLA|nr:hypothetical protein XELAEV_18026928mg [Xenopus laevis]
MGTIMRTCFAPQYANLFMAKLELDFLSTCNTKPMTYLRYIDDIFIIWTDTEQELTNHDPDHTKHSIIYSQALQYNRICSDTTERNHHLKTLKADFINRGYNPMIVDQYIRAANRIPRSHLLQYKQKPEINQVPLVVAYNPEIRTLRKIARDLQGTLHKDERLKNKIPIPDSLEEYNIHGHYNSSSSNVVYLIQCTKCITGGLYIGETGQSMRKRNIHQRFTITNKKLDTPIGNHFNSPHHSIKDLRI